MKTWLIVLGLALAPPGIPAAQAQQTIDITKITCEKFLAGQLTDSRSLAIWLNGYVNGQRGKTLIDPDTVRESLLIEYCVGHSKTLALGCGPKGC
jgi:acid stress chaperone HdeB